MTRDEYMATLKSNISSLTLDEQEEALQYYYDYFEEAGDDEKVMAELGTPEEVAQIIRERFSNVLVDTKKANDSKDNQADDEKQSKTFGALYYKFKNSEVKGLELSFGAAEVVMISGKTFSVETRGISKNNLLCRLDAENTLVVKNLNKLENLNFFSHERNSRIVPRILITVPLNAKLNCFKASIGAGNFIGKDVMLSFDKGQVSVGAGNFNIKQIDGSNLNLRCGMGNLKIEGMIKGRSNIDCGMGAIKLELKGNQDDYSHDAKVGLGDFKFNDIKRSGACQIYCDNKKDNHFSVNCGMGSVNITMK